MQLTVQDFIQRFERYCPTAMAEAGDPVGLQIGSKKQKITRIMVALDIRPETVSEAIDQNIDLIVAKHPIIFRPIKELVAEDPQEKMYMDLICHNISVYIAHTNLDIVKNGLNDWFCEELGITETTFIRETKEVKCKKLAVYVPESEAENMRIQLGKLGAGKIGSHYQNCSYTLQGTGRFTPIEGANPTIGKLNQPEIVREEKIEVVFPENLTDTIVKEMLLVHPYEEPAYDLYQLENFRESYGIGRIGNLSKAMPLEEFTLFVKKTFNCKGLRLITSNKKQMVNRIAICGGSGEKFYRDALKQGADVYITGDVYYHTAHDMLVAGLSVIDPGHYIESLCIPKLVTLFKEWVVKEQWQEIEILPSEANTNPFIIY